MDFEKVIKLFIKIFTWFYQTWISKIKIKSAIKSELRQILKRFDIRLRYTVKSRISFNLRPSAECENAASVINWYILSVSIYQLPVACLALNPTTVIMLTRIVKGCWQCQSSSSNNQIENVNPSCQSRIMRHCFHRTGGPSHFFLVNSKNSCDVLKLTIIKVSNYLHTLKGPDHLGPGLEHLGRFLGSTWDRQLKFSEFAWFRISWKL